MATIELGEVKLIDVRLSFLEVFEPAQDRVDKKDPTGKTIIKGQYKGNALMEKGTPATIANLAKIKAAGDALKAAKWGPDQSKWKKFKPDKVCLRDGNLENWEGYEGCFYVSANSQDQPVLIDRVKDPDGKWEPLTKANGGTKKIYSGARGNMIVRMWIQDNEHGMRMNAEIKCVQFRQHGDPFSGRIPVDPNAEGSGFSDDDVGPDDLSQIEDGEVAEDVSDLV